MWKKTEKLVILKLSLEKEIHAKKNHSAIINHGKKACINIVRTCGCKKTAKQKHKQCFTTSIFS